MERIGASVRRKLKVVKSKMEQPGTTLPPVQVSLKITNNRNLIKEKIADLWAYNQGD